MADTDQEEKQCRICLDGPDAIELGKLIRPCLCKGSISYVHVKCLQRWRNTSSSHSAFYACQQCGYQYHFARTRVSGIATNPVIVGAISAAVFTILVMSCSFITTWLLYDDGPTEYSYFTITPWAIFRNLVNSSVRYILGITELPFGEKQFSYTKAFKPKAPPSLLRRLVNRFLLGLPVVGAGSIVHVLLTLPGVPFHFLRFRTRQSNRDSRDYVALIMIVVVVIGCARAMWKVYQLTESLVQRLLLRAEDAILEVQ